MSCSDTVFNHHHRKLKSLTQKRCLHVLQSTAIVLSVLMTDDDCVADNVTEARSIYQGADMKIKIETEASCLILCSVSLLLMILHNLH